MFYINEKKDTGLRPKKLKQSTHYSEKIWFLIYQTYQETCDRSNLVDFPELLLRTFELLINNPNLLNYYQKKFTTILVDEFQDTNQIQYSWIQLLKIKEKNENNIMIVGDDDQSIYGWRGAQVDNIQRFIKDFSSVKIIRLEQNYRSTGNILRAANTLISKNKSRLGKNLWTKNNKGEQISLYYAINEFEEARFVAKCIKNWKKQGGFLNECSILYRSNVQSRILEEVFFADEFTISNLWRNAFFFLTAKKSKMQ